MGGSWLWWLIIPLCLICLGVAACLAIMQKGGKQSRSAKTKRHSGPPSLSAEDTRPLVQKVDTAMAQFDALDSNHDGVIDRAEFQAAERRVPMMTPPSLP